MDLEADGQHVPALENAPELFIDAVPFWDAFLALDSSRRIGFSAGGIPYSEVTDWLDENDIICLESRQRYRKFIGLIDNAYLGAQQKKSEAIQAKQQQGNKTARPKRG